MKDKRKLQPINFENVSSDSLRLAMRPSLRQVMAMKVINDNHNIDDTAMKELGFMVFGIVFMITVALTS